MSNKSARTSAFYIRAQIIFDMREQLNIYFNCKKQSRSDAATQN